jgi:hypothetical protein
LTAWFQINATGGVEAKLENIFAIVLSTCANLASLEQGIAIHRELITNGFQSDMFVESALVGMLK